MIEFTWSEMKLDASRACTFDYNGERIEMNACDVIVASWGKDEKASEYVAARDAWANFEAGKIVARKDYDASPEGIQQRALDELTRAAEMLASATAALEALMGA